MSTVIISLPGSVREDHVFDDRRVCLVELCKHIWQIMNMQVGVSALIRELNEDVSSIVYA